MRSKDPELMLKIKKFAERYYIDHNQSPSTATIAAAVGVVKGTVHRYLVEMNDLGIISYDGRDIVTEAISKVRPAQTHAAIIGDIACGLPQFAEENIEEYVSLPKTLFGDGEFYILRAKGESMIEAGISSGDLVIIRKQNHASNGQIVAALIDDEATLKKFYKDPKNQRIILHPENKTMEDIIVDDCRIQGVAVKVIKELK